MAKDPARIALGKAGMLARWGIPRVARLDDFEPDERAAILASIEARRVARKAAAGGSDHPAAASSSGASDARPTS